jgi:hypothetical protein
MSARHVLPASQQSTRRAQHPCLVTARTGVVHANGSMRFLGSGLFLLLTYLLVCRPAQGGDARPVRSSSLSWVRRAGAEACPASHETYLNAGFLQGSVQAGGSYFAGVPKTYAQKNYP